MGNSPIIPLMLHRQWIWYLAERPGWVKRCYRMEQL
jgi:hypothetical protein